MPCAMREGAGRKRGGDHPHMEPAPPPPVVPLPATGHRLTRLISGLMLGLRFYSLYQTTRGMHSLQMPFMNE